MVQRHREPRIRLRARIHRDGPDRFYMGFSENISSGGVFIESECPPSVGEEVHLIVGPEARPLHVGGIVRWHRVDERGHATGCGVQFTDLDESRRSTIADFLRRAPNDPLLHMTVDEAM